MHTSRSSRRGTFCERHVSRTDVKRLNHGQMANVPDPDYKLHMYLDPSYRQLKFGYRTSNVRQDRIERHGTKKGTHPLAAAILMMIWIALSLK